MGIRVFQIVMVSLNYLNLIIFYFITIPSYFMKECNCNELGSTTFICDQMSGQCDCKSDLIVGTQCDSSKDGFFNFPNPEGKNIKGSSNITNVYK